MATQTKAKRVKVTRVYVIVDRAGLACAVHNTRREAYADRRYWQDDPQVLEFVRATRRKKASRVTVTPLRVFQGWTTDE